MRFAVICDRGRGLGTALLFVISSLIVKLLSIAVKSAGNVARVAQC